MTARERIKLFVATNTNNGSTAYGNLARDMGVIDALLADIIYRQGPTMRSCGCNVCKEQLERAKALGYGRNDG